MEKNKFKWNDKDLVNIITAVNKFTNKGFFDDIQNNLSYDKNIKDENKLMSTDNSNKNQNEQSTKISMHRSQSLNFSNSFLLPLVIRRNEKIKMKKESRKN